MMSTEKDLNYWKANAEEDYMQVPISVLKYITELEAVVKNCSIPDVVGQSEQLVCNIEKGTRCKDSFPSYKDGKCYNCGGQAN